ncbi:MAG TPA: hypothetical protein DD473_04600 [Planctomycetaceae bacterium]|nr:hypothetical protein [Planctomycetaceae bacterium]|tara:strand:+ start:153 stop:1355 length:1203 start_codon:yes stop_codon:yes gene_type:complete
MSLIDRKAAEFDQRKPPSDGKSKPRPIDRDDPSVKRFKPNLITMSSIQAKPIHWLWDQRIPAGAITTLIGRPGGGKSWTTLDMTARVSIGGAWPDGSPCEQGETILMTSEDDPGQVIRPRLDAHGADCSKIRLLTSKSFQKDDGTESESMISLADIDLIKQSIEQMDNCKMLVIDPAGNHLSAGTDCHRDNEVRAILAPIAKLAERYQIAVVLVVHTRKGASTHADDLALGSRAFVGIARAVWHIMADPDDDTRTLMLAGKCNLSAKKSGLAFRIDHNPARVCWEEDPVDLSANEAMTPHNDGGEKSALDEAVSWLEDHLSNGKLPGKDVKKSAKADGISSRTLDRAKSKLNVVAAPDGMGGPWMWSLPEYAKDFPEYASTNVLAQTGDTVAHSADEDFF